MKRSGVVSVGLLLIGVCSVSAQSSPQAGLTANPVYSKDCAKCHGKAADGRFMGGPALISDKVAGVSAGDLRNMISNGKGRMPKFADKLSQQDIDTLVQEIQAANKK